MKYIFTHFKPIRQKQASFPNSIVRIFLQKTGVFFYMTALLCVSAITLQAQGPVKQWDKSITGMVDGQSELVVQTPQGDLVIGKISGNNSFQLMRVSNGNIIKLNKTYIGNDYTATSTILVTADQGYLLGSKVNNAAGKYYQVLKLSSDGQFQWKKKYGVPDPGFTNYLPVIQTTDNGFIIGSYTGFGIGGDKSGELKDLCPGYYQNPENCGYNSDYWIVKLDKNGNKLWDKSFGGGTEDNLRAMIPTADGGALLAGNSFSPKSVNSTNKTAPNLGMDDIWLVKVSSNGTKQWEKSLGGDDQDSPLAVIQTADGGFVISGESYSGSNPEKTVGYGGNNYYWLVKVDKDGKYKWDKLPNWKLDPDVSDIMIPSKEGGFYVGLSSKAGVGGIKSEPSRGDYDYWMIKYNSSGFRQWDKRFGGTKEDKLLAISEFSDATLQLFGYSKSLANGDKTVSNTGGWVVSTYPGAPTNLTATPVSANQINLQWKDNLVNENRYIIERAKVIAGDQNLSFSVIAKLNGSATTYSDVNLPSNTTYAYRIKAVRLTLIPIGQPFPPSGSSDYSNVVTAKLVNASVRITDFFPKSGPIGTEVTIKGYGFIEDNAYYVSDIKFNNKAAAPYGVESETEIKAKVAPGTTSGKISLITPGGTKIFSETSFTVTQNVNAGNQAARMQIEDGTPYFEAIRFYPNPVQNTLNLELPHLDEERILISVYDLTGKLYKTYDIISSQQVSQLDVSALTPGIYLLKLQNSHEQRNLRFVKQ